MGDRTYIQSLLHPERLLNSTLLDEMHVFIVQTLLGEGISLFSSLEREIKLELLETVSYKSGIVQLHYSLNKT